jgi:hypothetical protein
MHTELTFESGATALLFCVSFSAVGIALPLAIVPYFIVSVAECLGLKATCQRHGRAQDLDSKSRELNGATGRQISERLDQDVRGNWLDEKGDAADFQGPPFHRFIIIRSHEYDGNLEACVCKLFRQFNTATLAKLNIDNEADRFSHHRRIDELIS